jgi:alanine dehydrogenase
MFNKVIATDSVSLSSLQQEVVGIEEFLLNQNALLRSPLLNYLSEPLSPGKVYDKDTIRTAIIELTKQFVSLPTKNAIFFPKEMKAHENRFILTQFLIEICSKAGIPMIVQKGAGLNVNLTDEDIVNVAQRNSGVVSFVDNLEEGLAETKRQSHNGSGMVYMVKEPQPALQEKLLQMANFIIYSYLHPFAPGSVATTDALAKANLTGVSFDCFNQGLCLTGMSIIAAKKSVDFLSNLDAVTTKIDDNTPPLKTTTLGSIPGFPSRKGRDNTVLVLGIAGTAGQTAALEVLKAGGRVVGTDINTKSFQALVKVLKETDPTIADRITLINMSEVATDKTEETYAKIMDEQALYVVDCVKVPKGKTPELFSEDFVQKRKNIWALISVDEGSSMAKPPTHTTNKAPISFRNGNVIYSSPNMPSTSPVEASTILADFTALFGILIAKLGIDEALKQSNLLMGALVYQNGTIFRQ